MRPVNRILAAALLIASCAPATATGDAARGKRLYLAVGCFECHGRVGQGGVFNYPAPALAQLQQSWSLEGFSALVRLGPNDMPPYTAAVLSDLELADILAYLHTLPGASDAKGFPLLNE
jgi:mono/diheme cytochrome c family protein